MGRQPTKLDSNGIFERQRTDTNGRTTYENTDTKTTFENQRDTMNHGKTTHETKHEIAFSRDKEPIRMERPFTRTDMQRTFENQREIANHRRTTHITTKHKNDFSRAKGTLRTEQTTYETNHETDFSKDNGTTPMLIRLTPKTITK